VAKRGFWVAAWGVWAYLGVGLYRELPRELRAPVCKLAFAKSEEPVGFLHGEDVVVSKVQKEDPYDPRFTLWNARTGLKIAERRGIAKAISWQGGLSVSLRHGVLIGVRPDGTTTELQILDLRTGAWRPIEARPLSILDVHATRPWAAGVASKDGDSDDPRGLVVFDLRTGATIARWPGPAPSNEHIDAIDAACFRDDDVDELLILIKRIASGDVTKRFETWTIGGATTVTPLPLKNPYVELGSRIAANGSVVLTRYYATTDLDPFVAIVDSRTGKRILSSDEFPPLLHTGRSRWIPGESQLSASGCSFLTIDQGLWNVVDRRRLWKADKRFEDVYKVDGSNDAFLVSEFWKRLLDVNWLPFEGQTWAVRDFDTGAVRYRAARQHPLLNHFSSDGRLGVTFRGDVYAFPLAPNWPLLFVCQLLLALPLVLIGVVLRHRMRRTATGAARGALAEATS